MHPDRHDGSPDVANDIPHVNGGQKRCFLTCRYFLFFCWKLKSLAGAMFLISTGWLSRKTHGLNMNDQNVKPHNSADPNDDELHLSIKNFYGLSSALQSYLKQAVYLGVKLYYS